MTAEKMHEHFGNLYEYVSRHDNFTVANEQLPGLSSESAVPKAYGTVVDGPLHPARDCKRI